MNGYLQRIALSAIRPDQSIRPVLGSLFSPLHFAARSDAPAMETVKPVTSHDRAESETRPDPRAAFDAPGGDLVAEAASPNRPSNWPLMGSPKPAIPDLNQPHVIRALVDQGNTGIAPLLPAHSSHSSDQHEAGPLKPERERIVSPPPKQKVQREKASPEKVIVAGETPAETGAHRPRVERAPGAAVASRRTPITPLVETPGPELPPRTILAAAISPRRVLGSSGAQPVPPKTALTSGTATERVSDTPGREQAPKPGAARDDAPTLAGSNPVPLRFGSEGSERIAPVGRSARPEPDEIVIHIGRVEVIAVPPAPAPPVATKPQRWTPSLDEYLRGRDRRSA